jgi:hypothetical protein
VLSSVLWRAKDRSTRKGLGSKATGAMAQSTGTQADTCQGLGEHGTHVAEDTEHPVFRASSRVPWTPPEHFQLQKWEEKDQGTTAGVLESQPAEYLEVHVWGQKILMMLGPATLALVETLPQNMLTRQDSGSKQVVT